MGIVRGSCSRRQFAGPDPVFRSHRCALAGAFAARFAEVRIDEELGLLRIARIVSAIDAGRILNEKLARSQTIGAAGMGIGMTMLEETIIDSGTGRVANATFGDYLIPVNADVPDLNVVFVGHPDKFSPVGIKGLGEIGVVCVLAAITNAAYHAAHCRRDARRPDGCGRGGRAPIAGHNMRTMWHRRSRVARKSTVDPTSA